jgi:endonuclease YncB( thermonuclease family)
MPFTLIKGTFRLVNKTSQGNDTGFEPDGDSMQFKPNKPTLLDKLDKISSPYRLSKIGSTQLRFEGIDALELHFTAGSSGGVTHQPRPLADDARDELIDELDLDPVQFVAPRNIRVKPPAIHDGTTGYILSRSLEVHGRPVAFVYAGSTSKADGSDIHLTTALLKKSTNYAMLKAGQAYPLFYDSLFFDLRDTLARAAKSAKSAKRGLWKKDKTLGGLSAPSIPSLEENGVLFPKLFRRLTEFYGDGGTSLSKFMPWLEDKKERVLDLDTSNNTHFDTFVEVNNSKVKMNKSPDRLVFTSATSSGATWL